MIAATRIALRSVGISRRTRIFLIIAALAPLIVTLLSVVAEAIIGTASGLELGYTEALAISTMLTGPAILLVVLGMATVPHRHGVFEAHVLTGAARDLLLLGRLAAGLIVALATMLVSLGIGLLIHSLSYAGDDTIWRDGHGFSGMAGDIGVLLALLALAVTLVVAAGSIVRRAGTALGVVVGLTVAEAWVAFAVHSRWEQGGFIPLEDAATFSWGGDLPWWSVSGAAIELFSSVVDEGVAPNVLGAAAVLVTLCTVAYAAALYRTVATDA